MSQSVGTAPAAETLAEFAALAVGAEHSFANQMLGAQRQVSDMTLAFATEVMGFASRRMQAQAAFLSQLGHCTDAADVLDAQWRFVADTTQDYVAEMTTLTKVMQPE